MNTASYEAKAASFFVSPETLSDNSKVFNVRYKNHFGDDVGVIDYSFDEKSAYGMADRLNSALKVGG